MSREQNELPKQAPQPGAGAGGIVTVNGEPRRIAPGCSIEHLLTLLGLGGKRVAVAVNREVVPRSAHGRRRLASGDRIEILEAVGGG